MIAEGNGSQGTRANITMQIPWTGDDAYTYVAPWDSLCIDPKGELTG